MTTVFRGLLKPIWHPQRTTVRLKTRINIKKPRPPHFTRAKVEELCKPIYPKIRDPSVPLYELCKGPGHSNCKPENPYEVLLSKEALNWFKNHKYIFFFHLNSLKGSENSEMKLMLKKCGVVVRTYGRQTLQHTFIGSKYEPVLALFQSHTIIGFGNDVKLPAMLSGLAMTKIVLLAAIIDDRLLSVSEIKYYSNLPDISTLRGSLVSILNSAAGNVLQNLNHHPSTLVQHLEQHVKLSNEGNK